MSDAPRQPAPDDRADERHDPSQTDHDGPAAPGDALGAWPQDEAAAVPDEHAPRPEGDEGGETPADERPTAADDPRSREELFVALQDAESSRDEYLDDVRRARAEFENFRRRTMREGASQREAGKAEVLEGLLEVLDDLDRTLSAAEASDDEHLAKGVQMVAEKLVRSLQSAGLERVDRPGASFDPNQHEAVQQVESEEDREEPVVSQVLRPGYLLGDRVLRAAMVVVEQ